MLSYASHILIALWKIKKKKKNTAPLGRQYGKDDDYVEVTTDWLYIS